MAWCSQANHLLVCLVALGKKTTLVEYVFIPRHDISKCFSCTSK